MRNQIVVLTLGTLTPIILKNQKVSEITVDASGVRQGKVIAGTLGRITVTETEENIWEN